MAELTYRTRRILYATITEYIATGEPVGSRRLAKGYGIELSPATIRNVLSDLEDAGFLAQPHTSAGRVPTDKGFRVFVDALVQMREVPADDRTAILQRLKNLEPGTDVLKEAGELLSALTGAAALITAPRPEEERLAQLRFMPLREGQLLAVLVTTTGAIQNRVVRVDDPVDERQLERVNNLLAEALQDGASSLVGMRDSLAKEMEQQRDVAEDARAIIAAVMNETTPAKMVIEGQGRLFDRPEFVDADKIRRYLKALDDKERLLELLQGTLMSGGVRVLIGAETRLEDVTDVSVVSTPYESTGAAGSIGIIGPTRMDYGKVVPLVGFTAKVMSEVLQGQDDDSD